MELSEEVVARHAAIFDAFGPVFLPGSPIAPAVIRSPRVWAAKDAVPIKEVLGFVFFFFFFEP
jgi:hypothetical protein